MKGSGPNPPAAPAKVLFFALAVCVIADMLVDIFARSTQNLREARIAMYLILAALSLLTTQESFRRFAPSLVALDLQLLAWAEGNTDDGPAVLFTSRSLLVAVLYFGALARTIATGKLAFGVAIAVYFGGVPILFSLVTTRESLSSLGNSWVDTTYLFFFLFACVAVLLLSHNKALRGHRAAAEELTDLRAEITRAGNILSISLPKQVAHALLQGAPASSLTQTFATCTVAFIHLDDYKAMVAAMGHWELITRLGVIYSEFDSLVEQFPAMYKVETVGSTYMVAGGIPTPSHRHARDVVQFCARLLDRCNDIGGTPVKIRIGINCGPATGAVIGRSRSFYRLFGNTVNVASRMVSTGETGKVHVTGKVVEALQEDIADGTVHVQPRERVFIKGKGMMSTFFLAFGATPQRTLHTVQSSAGTGAAELLRLADAPLVRAKYWTGEDTVQDRRRVGTSSSGFGSGSEAERPRRRMSDPQLHRVPTSGRPLVPRGGVVTSTSDRLDVRQPLYTNPLASPSRESPLPEEVLSPVAGTLSTSPDTAAHDAAVAAIMQGASPSPPPPVVFPSGDAPPVMVREAMRVSTPTPSMRLPDELVMVSPSRWGGSRLCGGCGWLCGGRRARHALSATSASASLHSPNIRSSRATVQEARSTPSETDTEPTTGDNDRLLEAYLQTVTQHVVSPVAAAAALPLHARSRSPTAARTPRSPTQSPLHRAPTTRRHLLNSFGQLHRLTAGTPNHVQQDRVFRFATRDVDDASDRPRTAPGERPDKRPTKLVIPNRPAAGSPFHKPVAVGAPPPAHDGPPPSHPKPSTHPEVEVDVRAAPGPLSVKAQARGRWACCLCGCSRGDALPSTAPFFQRQIATLKLTELEWELEAEFKHISTEMMLHTSLRGLAATISVLTAFVIMCFAYVDERYLRAMALVLVATGLLMSFLFIIIRSHVLRGTLMDVLQGRVLQPMYTARLALNPAFAVILLHILSFAVLVSVQHFADYPHLPREHDTADGGVDCGGAYLPPMLFLAAVSGLFRFPIGQEVAFNVIVSVGFAATMLTLEGVGSITCVPFAVSEGGGGTSTNAFGTACLAAQLVVTVLASLLREQQERARFLMARAHIVAFDDSELILQNLFPPPVVHCLKTRSPVQPQIHATAGILYCDIVGFTHLASQHNPRFVSNLLNRIYTAFDTLVEQHGLYKMDTIGDAYVVVGGLFDEHDVDDDGSVASVSRLEGGDEAFKAHELPHDDSAPQRTPWYKNRQPPSLSDAGAATDSGPAAQPSPQWPRSTWRSPSPSGPTTPQSSPRYEHGAYGAGIRRLHSGWRNQTQLPRSRTVSDLEGPTTPLDSYRSLRTSPRPSAMRSGSSQMVGLPTVVDGGSSASGSGSGGWPPRPHSHSVDGTRSLTPDGGPPRVGTATPTAGVEDEAQPAPPCRASVVTVDTESVMPPSQTDLKRARAFRRVLDELFVVAHEFQLALEQLHRELGTKVSIRAAIHAGPVATGIVGRLQPRFHVFGSTMLEAEAMDAEGMPGRVLCSRRAHELYNMSSFAFTPRPSMPPTRRQSVVATPASSPRSAWSPSVAPASAFFVDSPSPSLAATTSPPPVAVGTIAATVGPDGSPATTATHKSDLHTSGSSTVGKPLRFHAFGSSTTGTTVPLDRPRLSSASSFASSGVAASGFRPPAFGSPKLEDSGGGVGLPPRP